MSNELSVPNLADSIRDRVRQSIVSIIPDGQIDGLVQKEWTSFFQAPEKRYSYDEAKSSPFQEMVRKEVQDFMYIKIKDSISKELKTWQEAQWDAKGQEAIKQLIEKYAASALHGIAGVVVNDFMSKMQQNRTY